MQAAFRRCLEELDVPGIQKLWAHVSPHLPQPRTDQEALVCLHHARTQAQSMPLRARAYSHRWLLDHGYPSGLPDELRPRAERMYPRIAEGVGIAVKATSSGLAVVAKGIQKAMSDAVMDAYAEGRTDPAFVKARMGEARDKTRKYFRELLEGHA